MFDDAVIAALVREGFTQEAEWMRKQKQPPKGITAGTEAEIEYRASSKYRWKLIKARVKVRVSGAGAAEEQPVMADCGESSANRQN